jgi:NADPH:quinone reductase-like Zn-dependent oxidoreductase
VRALGGDVVLVDGENLGARIVQALDGAQLRLVLDGAAGTTPGELAQSLEFGGTVVSYSSATGQAATLPLGDLIFRELQLRGFWLINWIRNAPRAEIEQTYTELAELVAKGELGSAVEATYPLSQYREAFAHARRPGRSGKVLFSFEGTSEQVL